MAAFDMSDPKAVVSPGGVGFDINCGVRLLRTNLYAKDVLPIKVKQTSQKELSVYPSSIVTDDFFHLRNNSLKVYSIIFPLALAPKVLFL